MESITGVNFYVIVNNGLNLVIIIIITYLNGSQTGTESYQNEFGGRWEKERERVGKTQWRWMITIFWYIDCMVD